MISIYAKERERSHQEGKKEKEHKSPHREKTTTTIVNESSSSSKETGARGFFLVLQTKHLDHTIEMVNKKKICIKKHFLP